MKNSKVRQLHILVLDDDFTLADALARAVEQRGLGAAEAVCGEEEACQLLEEGGIDLALFDVLLGARPCDQAVAAANRAGVPVVLVSGGQTAHRLEMLPKTHVFLTKPVNLEELDAAVAQLVKRP